MATFLGDGRAIPALGTYAMEIGISSWTDPSITPAFT
jgi:hypothetical protein